MVDRPDKAGSERHRREDQDENESLEGGQNEHTPPLADENLAIEQTLKRRVGRVRNAVHVDSFGGPVSREAGGLRRRRPRACLFLPPDSPFLARRFGYCKPNKRFSTIIH